MIDFLRWIRQRFWPLQPDPPAEPDPAAERAVKLPAEEFQPDGTEDGDRDG